MTTALHLESLRVLEALRPGDWIELEHEVKVGFRQWQTRTIGEVVGIERRRHGLHRQRSFDDKVFSDMIVLRLHSGELTTVTLDEFSRLRQIPPPAAPGK